MSKNLELEKLNMEYGHNYRECPKCRRFYIKDSSLIEQKMCSYCWVDLHLSVYHFEYYSPQTNALFDLYYYGSTDKMFLAILKKLDREKDYSNIMAELKGKTDDKIIEYYIKLKELESKQIKSKQDQNKPTKLE